jgi:hypothetical protein
VVVDDRREWVLMAEPWMGDGSSDGPVRFEVKLWLEE